MSDAERKVIKHIVKIDNMEIKVAKKRVSNAKLLESGILSPDDADMDKRVKQAVSSAIKRTKVCKKPLAVYDKNQKKPFLVDSDGKQVKIG